MPLRRLVLFFLFCISCSMFAVGSGAAAGAAAPPRPGADAYILLDPVSMQVLAESNAYRLMAPASTTKIMTCLLVLENCSPVEVARVSRRAARTGGSRIGLREGQLIAVEDLLYGLMLRSGNDAAAALAEHVAGTIEDFAALMNRRARELGALATNFINPHGLTAPQHYSTAYDLAVIACAAMQDPRFAALVRSREREIGSLDPAWTRLVRNTNQLLWTYEGADGVKTGTTDEAGQCLVASATRGGRQLLSVVLHSGNRWRDTARLLDYGFDETALVVAARSGDPAPAAIARDPVRLPYLAAPLGLSSLRIAVPAVLGGDLAFVHPLREPPALEVVYATPEGDLTLPIAEGQRVGTALAYSHGVLVASSPLVATRSIPRGLVYARLVEALANGLLGMFRQGLP